MPDNRDRAHLMTIQAGAPIRKKRMHRMGKVLDQGPYPACVSYAWMGFYTASPLRNKYHDPLPEYYDIQKVDEFEGENYDGTSVRGGAKYYQQLGRIQEYSWAFQLMPAAYFVLDSAPVVLGTNWYGSMFYPSSEGIVKIESNASVAGGHAYLMNGVDMKRGLARFVNSWGTSWGLKGVFWMALETVERLIIEDGEACTAKELAAL